MITHFIESKCRPLKIFLERDSNPIQSYQWVARGCDAWFMYRASRIIHHGNPLPFM